MLGPTAAVIGVGLNVRLPAALKQLIDQPATDVASHLDAPASRNQLLAAMLRELVTVLDEFNEHGFKFFQNDWLQLHALQEKVVTVRQSNRDDCDATVKGVAEDGALVVEFFDQPGVAKKLSSAEISVRMVEHKERISTHATPQKVA